MTPSSDSLTNRVRQFVACATPVSFDRIALESSLEDDLGIDAESAPNFFAAFAWLFDVDLSGLDIAKHFGLIWTSWGWLFFVVALPPAGIGYAVGVPLPAVILVPLAVLWLGGRIEGRIQRQNQLEIRVKDLVQAAESGRWRKENR